MKEKINPVREWFRQQLESQHQSNESELLKELTIIVPSYNRQDFLLRQIAYWVGTKVHLIIADGSQTPLDNSVFEGTRDLLRLTYLHNPVHFSERLSVASRCIDTKYTVLSGDDEFLLKTGLAKAINKLEMDPSLVACIGQSLHYYLSDNKKTITFGAGYPHWKYEVAQPDAVGRLRVAMEDYNAATCYAVLRSNVWCKSWGSGKTWTSPYAIELQQAISTYISGKLSTVDEIYWMRSSENKPVSIKGSNRTLSFEEWWTSMRFLPERKDFVNSLAIELVSGGDIDMDILLAHQYIEELVEKFLLPERSRRKAISKLARLFAFLRSATGRILRLILTEEQFIKIKSIIYESRKNNIIQGDLGSIRDLRSLKSQVVPGFNDELLIELCQMESLISSFYEARQL